VAKSERRAADGRIACCCCGLPWRTVVALGGAKAAGGYCLGWRHLSAFGLGNGKKPVMTIWRLRRLVCVGTEA